jgi:hypothetical protein
MSKFILMLLLAVVSHSAMAEWIEYGYISKGTASESTLYVNPGTIRKSGTEVKIWTLEDYKTAQKLNAALVKSIKNQTEYDCEEEQVRWLASYEYKGNMGLEELVYTSSGSGKWYPVVPGSVGEATFKYACGK